MSNPRNIEDPDAGATDPTPPARKENPLRSTSLELDALEAMRHTARKQHDKEPPGAPPGN